MKRAIITGATGMIGVALINRLLKENIEITAVVRPNSSRKSRIPDDSRIRIIECELNELNLLSEKLSETYDCFFHFGWGSTFGDGRNNMPVQVRNIEATIDAVELAHKLNCSVFVGAGSQAEYGRVEGTLTPKTPTFPENGYGMAKLCAGQMSQVLCTKYNIRHVWMRILSIYGPNDGKHTMVMSGMHQMLQGERPSYTKAEQMWDYLYCGDAADAMYLAATNGKENAVYCLGSGNARPLKAYIEEIRDVVNPNSDIGFGDIPYFDKQVMYLCADIQNLQKDTGFVPKTEFKDGIQKTYEWLKEEMKHEEN